MSLQTVLVVDDEAGVRESLRRMLLGAGWRPLTATSPSEALAALAADPPDAAILDVCMPDENGVTSGIDLLAHIRQWAACRRLPVIVLTGRFLTPAEDAVVRHHNAAVLYKPAELRTITALLDSLQRQARESDSGAA